MCKFSKEDLRRFNERLMNVLQNDECRQYFTEFVGTQMQKYQRAFRIWTIVYDCEEPDNVLENVELTELMDECGYLLGKECPEEIESKSVEYLNRLHKNFMKFLKTKNNIMQTHCSTSSTST